MVRLVLALAALLLPAELPPELAGLEAEGAKWFNEAGKTDLPASERNEARKKAWVNLYRAKEILDAHWDAHPGDQDRIEDRMMNVGKMVFWIKKESPIGLLEGTGVGPKAAGSVKRDWPATPPPEKPGAAPGGEAPSPAPASAPAAAPAPATPARTFDEEYAEADAWARKHRADLAGVMERFQALLAKYPDQTSHPLYAKAVQRAGEGSKKMKDAYRKMRNDDPDSLKGGAPDDPKVLIGLTRDLGSPDPSVRERAAKLLGDLGSGEASFSLGDRMRREKEAAPLKAMGDALAAIGGRKSIEQLHKFRDDELAPRAFEWLLAIEGRNPVDRRLAVKEMGEFALSKDEAVAGKAVDRLVALGPDGASGLLHALKTPSTEIRLKIIPALGASKEPKAAAALSSFLLIGDIPGTVRCRDAARDAITALHKDPAVGEKVVPHLFAGLRNAGTKMYTGDLLRKLTGQMFSASRPGDWQRWWKQAHPDWKADKDDAE